MNMMRQYFTLVFCLTLSISYAQEAVINENSEPILTEKDSILDTSTIAEHRVIDTVKIDTTLLAGQTIALIDHVEVSEFDKKWLESWKNNVIDSSLIIKPEDTIGKVVIENFTTEQLKERIAYLDSQTPFNFEYNPSLEKIIKHYLKNRQQTLANLMGKAKYYFPMFEEHLAKYDIPMELKYLAIVESALKANATSRVGAKGLWQFMY